MKIKNKNSTYLRTLESLRIKLELQLVYSWKALKKEFFDLSTRVSLSSNVHAFLSPYNKHGRMAFQWPIPSCLPNLPFQHSKRPTTAEHCQIKSQPSRIPDSKSSPNDPLIFRPSYIYNTNPEPCHWPSKRKPLQVAPQTSKCFIQEKIYGSLISSFYNKF